MTTEELIRHLSAQATPVRYRAAWIVLGPGLIIGALAAVGLVALFMGVAAPESGGWLAATIAFGLTFSGAGLVALLPLLRPGADTRQPKRYIFAAAALLGVLLVIQLADTPSGFWSVARIFEAVVRCPLSIVAFALPVFGTLLIALRSEAPTHLNLTGAALGLTSGGIAAAAYALGCRDCLPPDSVVCATLGIALATGAGSIAGPCLLRW